ncbi:MULTISPECIES: extensin [Burkholderia]|uniref:Extensin n=1 Tax=Burkholderia anthina TaxID=179879 RepID=A0A7T6VHY9_9BURK|nr:MULTISPECIES: extensin [Burkholderia]QQK04294.1 extensin [Burkholderia anthina]
MTRTRKTLMIAGGLLVAAAGTGYVMLLRADHRAIAEAGIGDSATPVAVAAVNDGHTAEGSIAPPAAVAVPSAHVDDTVPQQPPAARTSAAPVSAAAVPGIAAHAPSAQPSVPPPTVHVVTVEPEGATPPKAKPAQPVQSTPPVQAAQAGQPSQQAYQQAYQPSQHAASKRDGLERHAAATAARNAETPETAELVRESAKLDPSLPPPQYVPPSNPDRQHASAGSNAVAAALTDQLVRQSSSFTAPAPANAGPAVAQ